MRIDRQRVPKDGRDTAKKSEGGFEEEITARGGGESIEERGGIED